jgi:hypothetical protein
MERVAERQYVAVMDGRRERVELGGAGGDVAAVDGPQCRRRKVFRQVGGEVSVEDRAEDGGAEAKRAERMLASGMRITPVRRRR